ncbi:hypothetical protein L873DRAFT_1723704, partial [Choiromyces venosus 120613-1]
FYSGYKKCHAYKFQPVMILDRLLSYLAGPWLGCKGDWGMYLDFRLEQYLQSVNNS